MIDFYAFSDELVKISGIGDRLLNAGKKLGLLETDAQSAMRTVRKVQKSLPGPSSQAQNQLKQMKLQRQLDEMKRARGLA